MCKRIYSYTFTVGIGFKVFLAMTLDNILFKLLYNVYPALDIVRKAVATVKKSLLHTAETGRLNLKAITLYHYIIH